MQPRERQALEQRIQDLCARGETGRAAEVALTGYQRELTRLLDSILHDRERARDAFGVLAETLLRDLPSFRWESTFRTWVFRVARNVGYRQLDAPSRREQPVSHGAFEGEAHREWSRTPAWQRTAVKERFHALRSKLTPHEQALLSLRLERRLSWLDAARELSPEAERTDAAALARRAAVLRQQFQRIKTRLRELAQQEQLLSRESSSVTLGARGARAASHTEGSQPGRG